MNRLQHDAPPSETDTAAPRLEDHDLVEALRRGDEAAFESLLDHYHTSLVRLAQLYVASHAVAEEVAQETWLGVLQGLHRFEGRSSLKTWIFQILTNRAKTRAQREGRTIPFSVLGADETEPEEPSVDPERFLSADHPNWPHHWATPPRSWDAIPEERFLAGEVRAHVDAAITALPSHQRAIITLRDIEGWTSAEVCNVFGITETNQRVLLHRARSKVRRALEQYFDEGEQGYVR
jgi:RNA polymerase sigma-70 factor (ECF subfamily)